MDLSFQKWQQGQAEKDSALTKQIAALQETHHQENRYVTAVQFRYVTAISIFAAIGAAVSAVVSVVALLYG